VVGALLGSVNSDGSVALKNSFAMPHDQLDQDFLGFFNTMSELHHRVNPRENVVGWYTTTKASDTDAVGEEDAHLHAFFEEKIGDRYPCVLLRVDANIQSATSIGVSAFVARSLPPPPLRARVVRVRREALRKARRLPFEAAAL